MSGTDPGITYRLVREDEVHRTREIFIETSTDLHRRHGRPDHAPGAGAPAERAILFRHNAIRYDHERFVVAESPGRGLVGFGIATLREKVWYLAALYALPDWQSRGIGRELLRRCLSSAPADAVLTVISEALNPVSNALYAKAGMYPQTPLIGMSGPTGHAVPETDLVLVPFPDGGGDPSVLGAIDVATLDCQRPEDYLFWAQVSDLHGFYVRRHETTVGYAYVQEDGALGPIATLRTADFAPVLGLAIAAARDLGATSGRVRIPGTARTGVALLLDHEWRFGDGFSLFLSSAPYGRFDRYLTSGADALF